MTKITKCDLCGEVVEMDSTYGIDIYSMNTKSHLKIDGCHKCTMEKLLNTIPTATLKWKKWDKELKQFVDAK